MRSGERRWSDAKESNPLNMPKQALVGVVDNCSFSHVKMVRSQRFARIANQNLAL